MTFHVRMTLQDIHPTASRGIIAIGETVMIREGDQAPLILTSHV